MGKKRPRGGRGGAGKAAGGSSAQKPFKAFHRYVDNSDGETPSPSPRKQQRKQQSRPRQEKVTPLGGAEPRVTIQKGVRTQTAMKQQNITKMLKGSMKNMKKGRK